MLARRDGRIQSPRGIYRGSSKGQLILIFVNPLTPPHRQKKYNNNNKNMNTATATATRLNVLVSMEYQQ